MPNLVASCVPFNRLHVIYYQGEKMSIMTYCPMKKGGSVTPTYCLVRMRSRKLLSVFSHDGPDPDSRVGRPGFVT